MNKEIQLIRKIQKRGDRAAADLLIQKYYDEIYCYAFKQTANKDVAMDLTQNIFISMLRSITNYDEKLAGFRTWLYKIATNKMIDYLRSYTAERKLLLDVEDIDIPDETEFTKQVEDNDLISQVMEYVNSLDVTAQQIFRLKFFAEHTFSQIANLLILPEATVKTKYYRSLKTLREEFRDEYY